MVPPTWKKAFFFAPAMLVTLGLSVLTFARARPGGYDDPYILLVYVRHLAQSGSIYWNAEEGPVDGCTSMLDLVVKTGIYKLVGGDLFRLNWIITFVGWLAAAALGVWLTAALTERFGRRLHWLYRAGIATLGAFALATNRASVDGAKMLLETPILLIVLLGSIALQTVPTAYSRRTLLALGISWILLPLARPEGLLLVAFFGIAFVRSGPKALTRRERLLPLGIAAVGLGLYYAWHTLHFGYWAPNSYYAKTSDSRWQEILDGLHYLRDFGRASPPWGSFALLGAWFAIGIAPTRSWQTSAARRAYRLFVGAAVANVLGVIYAGGDIYPGLARFFACSTTLMTIALVIACMGHAAEVPKALAATGLLFMTLASIFVAAITEGPEPMSKWPVRPASWWGGSAASTLLRANGITTIAVTDFEQLKFYDDDLLVIDASGLSDKRAAHWPAPGEIDWGKGGVAYALERRPEAIVWGWRTMGYLHDPSFATVSEQELLDDSELAERLMGRAMPRGDLAAMAREYRPAEICGRLATCINVWLRADVAATLAGHEDVDVAPMTVTSPIPLEGANGVTLEGFWNVESEAGRKWRWTNGHARLSVESLPGGYGYGCGITVTTWREDLSRRWPVRVSLDGEELARVSEVWMPRWWFPREMRPGPHVIAVESPTFRDGERDLGVMVTGLGVWCPPVKPP